MPDRHPTPLAALSLVLVLLVAQAASAQVAPGRNGDLARRAVSSDRLAVGESVVPLSAETESLLTPEVRDAWAAFQLGVPGEWRAYADRRTGRIEYAEGAGLPWIPGRGNRLTLADIAGTGGKVDLSTLERIARDFLSRTTKLLGVDPATLVLNHGRSGQAADYLWFVDFDLVRDGRTVEGARVTFTVNNGNLIQFGTLELPPPEAAVPASEISREAALAVLSQHVGGFTSADRFVDPGSLHLLPVDLAGLREGRGLLAVWEFSFRRAKVMGTWRGRIDATTGELLAFTDVNEYAQATGGIYPKSFATEPEALRPLPFLAVSSGVFTDSAGLYDHIGGAVNSQLFGPYVAIHDNCGAISLDSSGSGFLHFGLSSGTDCATPGFGGLGNTHSSRMQFYQVNRIKEMGRGWLPNNSWLSSPLGVNVNLNQVCNAYWDFSSLNFFHSGGGCGNTGEIAGVSLHEYGHGLDQNDGGGSSPDGGTRESYADVTAALVSHDSCGGPGFLGGNCGGYGDACTACTGVRDLDWARHVSGAPHTAANFTQTFCQFGFGDDGPCGREAHCESYIPSEAVWDLAARDLPGAGSNLSSSASWALLERLWYRSRAVAGSAFTCNTSGANLATDGCAAGTLWRVLRAADDDDGNLANGTPHSCALYAALARHGIACPSDPAAATCFAACTPPAVPTLTLTPGSRQMRLDWTDVGPGVVYDIYRNELSCNAGFTRIATVPLGTAYLDTAVTEDLTYNYQVIARPNGNEACSGAPSVCRSAAPIAPACGLAAPATLTATAVSSHGVTLSWSAVPGATDYSVYRGTASGGPYTQVQSLVAPTTTWTDSGLASGTPVFYVVRAAADCTSPASPEATATPFVCSGQPIYSNDFESGSGLGDWSTGSLNAGQASEWRGIQACDAHGGQKVFHFGGPGCTDNYDTSQYAYAQVGGAAGIAMPAGVSDPRLTFWHRFDFEYGFDSGTLALSLDGIQFFTLPASVFLTNPPNYGSGFTGTQATFVSSVVDLDAACNLAGAGTAGCAGRTLYLRFVAFSDSIITAQGWFLDDVTVSACTPHGCTGAPVAGAATTPANGQIQVSWTNGAPPSATFDVYRALGTCASPGPFTRIASQTAGSPFLDTAASGTVTFAYHITGREVTGQCESDPSACLQATATGPCTGAPLFAGLTSAGNGAIDLCSANLSWSPATALCGGPVTYNVYRGTTAGFTPTPQNRIATGVSGTTFADLGPLTDSTTYYYLVRAVDSANGAEDTNLVQKSATPTGPTSIGSLNDTFEGTASGGGFDRAGWSHAALTGVADWSWSSVVSQSPSHSWYSASLATAADRVLVSPPFGVLPGTTLSFWHTYSFYSCFDGGALEISTDGGATWSSLSYAAYTAGGPQDYLYSSPNPLANQLGWCFSFFGTPTQVTADLSAYAGSQAQLRWHAGDSGYSGTSGSSWYVDSVSITHTGMMTTCTSAPPPPLRFYTVTPCRLIDTRNPTGPLGGPALPAGSQRTFTLPGVCGLPATAKAVAINLTAVSPATPGDLRLFAADHPAPLASAINFAAGQTRTNNAIVGLSPEGAFALRNDAGTGVQVVVDLVGYFQ